MKKKTGKKIMAIFMTFVMVIGLIPALMLTASAVDIGPLSATVNTPLQLILHELSGGADLDPNTNGEYGIYYMQTYSEPVDGSNKAQLYIFSPEDIEYGVEYAGEIDNNSFIYFNAQQPGIYTFMVTLQDIDMAQPTITSNITVEVSSANTAPMVTTSAGSTFYTEQAAAIAIDSGIAITDPDDDADWNGGTLSVQITGNNAPTDLLSLPTSNGGAIWLDTTGNKLMSDTTQIGTAGTASATNGAVWTFAFNEKATDNFVCNTAGAVQFSSSANDPVILSRTITFTATDKNATAMSATKAVAITPVNDAPTLTATGLNPTFTEGGSAATLFSTAAVSTVESGQTLTELIMTVTNVADDASEALTADGTSITLANGNGTTTINGMSYNVSVIENRATVTLSKMEGNSAVDMQTLVNGISYSNTSDTPTIGVRVITLTSLQDNGGTANGGVDTKTLSVESTVTVAAVNDMPTVTAPTEIAYTDTAANNTFSNSAGSISANDIDGTIASYGISGGTGGSYSYNEVAYDVCKTGTYGALYVNSNNGNYVFVPNASAINAVTANQNETFTITATDDGSATGTATLTIYITGDNDTPSDIALTNSSICQSGGTNAMVGTLSTTDRDSGQTYTYSFATGNGTNDSGNISFNILGSSLRANNAAWMTAGTYHVYIRTTDSGNASFDKAFVITVSDDVAPSVSLVSVPSNGTYNAEQDLNFTVNFNEAITVDTTAGTPRIALTIGSTTRYADYLCGSGFTALTFRYTVQSGDNDSDGVAVGTLSANGGTLRDAAGNNAALTLNSVGSTAAVHVDAMAPGAPTLAISSDMGISNHDGVTKTAAQTITVSGEVGASVDLDFGDGSDHATGTIGAGGTFTAPAHTYGAGSYTISAALTDAVGNTSVPGTKTVVIDTAVPSITTSANQIISTTAATNDATVCTLAATDATSISGFTDAFSWSVTGGADSDKFSITGADLKINNVGGLSAGNYSVQVTAADTAGNTNTQMITVKVVSGPTVGSVSWSYDDDTAANDTFGNKAGTISATANSGAIIGYGIKDGTTGDFDIDGVTYNVSKDGTYGTLYVKSTDGAYVYLPSSNEVLNALTVTVTDTFTIEATDSAGTTGNTLTITINGVNDAPTLASLLAVDYTDSEAADTFSNTTGTLSGDDRDIGASLTYGISGGIPGGGANIGGIVYDVSKAGTYGTLYVKSGDGAYVYVPVNSAINGLNADQSDIFTVSVSDGALSATQTYTISITAANDASTVDTNNTLTIDEDAAAASIDTYLESSDVDSGTITYTITTSPTKGTLTNDGSALALSGTFTQADIDGGKIKYTPSANANGADSFIFTVSDGTNNVTNQTFNITITAVNDAPIISTAAAISVTEGSTTAFTASATDPEGSAISWSITGGADLAKFSIGDSTGAVSFVSAPAFSTPTDADADNDYVLEITASDGALTAVKTITVTVTQRVSSGGGDTSDAAVVEVDGEKQDAGTANTQTTDGQIITTIKVDDAKLDKILENSGDAPIITIPNVGSDVTVGELTGQTVKNMEAKEATLEIKTETATYTLPASQINIDAVSAQLGTQIQLKDIKVSVRIAEPPADTVKFVEDTVNKGGYQLVVKPIEFEITCSNEGRKVEVSRFNGYVERTIAIPDGVDPSKITTGIVLNADGSFRHVPTQVIVIDGKYYAKINSLTNSTYSVVYNPVTFKDVANHWARDAVNDMGSRMVVTGIGNGLYEPDRGITRAEFAAIIVRALGLAQGTAESSFNDVALTDWFNGYVDTAAAYALITGYDSDSYGPNDLITREQAMTILARAMKLTGLNISLTDSDIAALLAEYTDGENVASYAETGAAICIKTGVVSGSSATTLSPDDYVTRAQVAVMVQRLLQKSGLI